MDHRQLGSSGSYRVCRRPRLQRLRRRDRRGATHAVVDAAVDAGVTLFDTADIYGGPGQSEELLGRRSGAPRRGRGRDQVRLRTCGRQRARLGRPRLAARTSVRPSRPPAPARHRLDRPLPAARARPGDADRGDAGRPGRAGRRGQGALHRHLELRRLAGGRRRLDRAHAPARRRSCRRRTSTRCSTATAEAELVPACEHVGVGMLPYFPLAYGLLTGKYRRGEAAPRGHAARVAARHRLDDADFDRIEALAGVRRRARRVDARRGDRRPGRAAGGRLGDRRRDHARAGARQRRGRSAGSRRPRTWPRSTRWRPPERGLARQRPHAAGGGDRPGGGAGTP